MEQARHLFGGYSRLPNEHLWRYDCLESMSVPDADEDRFAVEVYQACLEDLTATVLGLAWKSRECTAVAVHALNHRRLAGSASAARAAFEAATAAIDHVVRLKNARSTYRKTRDFGEFITRLDESSMRGLWGRRGTTARAINANHLLKHQESVIKFAVADHEEIATFHPRVYDVLCNIAHPSADGHQHFWRLPDTPVPEDGAPIRIPMSASPDLRPAHFELQLTSILWALGWSCAHAVRAYELCHQAQERAAAAEADDPTDPPP